MKHILAASLAALAALALTGCTAAEPPGSAAVQQWLDEQDRASAGSGAFMSGLASTSETADAATKEGRQEGVRIEMDESERISTIEFTCFGAETMDARVSVESSSSAEASVHKVRCDAGPETIDTQDAPVSAVTINGVNADGFGAWAASFR
ncbi:hypothetical protein ACIPV2_07970 [Microbacterium sp. NPDC089987]|uniref:hypothetical protein n=1 Tax=Microbacterium sp. NPDC089987 TaxID=3364202 RepID=UPI003820A305